jgi:cytochrome c peroxidase
MSRIDCQGRAPAHSYYWRAAWLLALGLAGCVEQPQVAVAQDQALRLPPAAHGKLLFERPLPNTNGRACATCHVLDEATTLRPKSVAERLRSDPDDPLFDRLDADDPDAAELSFEHLEKGLVRVVLSLPDNMDVIDFDGNVITPPDRKIFVWRGVPSVADTAFTAPYQMDGREPTLQAQAQGAIISHSQGEKVSSHELDRIAQFQRGVFSSPRARLVAQIQALGVPDEKLPIPEEFMPLTAAQERGREIYAAACEACHGGATTDRITRPEVVDFLFPALTPQGNVLFERKGDQPPAPVRRARPGARFMNAGFGALSYVGQIGLATPFNATVSLPRYRFRFYRDETRGEAWLDLPPVPSTASGDPHDLRPAIDVNGAPIVGPNLIPQQFTTDPGRAVITGDPADFEAFDTPPLRGIAQTAPYYHDNSLETLRAVVDEYSRFLLPFLEPLALETFPPEEAGGRKEALSPEQKNDLLEFLEIL